MKEPITFFVDGEPKPAGSKRGFFIPKLKRVVITDACKGSKDWKTDVRLEAKRHFSDKPLECPIALTLNFFVVRPKSHRKGGDLQRPLKDNAPRVPVTRPDVLKLTRAVEDALTGIIWVDDSQIVRESLSKNYSDRGPGVWVCIREFCGD